jgi:obg-like ATPase 1
MLGELRCDHVVQALKKLAAEQECDMIVMSAQVEAELNELDEKEAQEYLEGLGISEGGLKSLVKATYAQLGLRTFFTTGEKETRAWTFRKGMSAPQCAGVIHSDFEKLFIRAETVGYDDFVASKGFGGSKEKGLLRLEGKDYVVQEGDVMLFRTGA